MSFNFLTKNKRIFYLIFGSLNKVPINLSNIYKCTVYTEHFTCNCEQLFIISSVYLEENKQNTSYSINNNNNNSVAHSFCHIQYRIILCNSCFFVQCSVLVELNYFVWTDNKVELHETNIFKYSRIRLVVIFQFWAGSKDSIKNRESREWAGSMMAP